MAQLDRMNVAPVSNLTTHYGNIIPAGTIGNLCYSVHRRRWTFVVGFTQYRINRADLFRFVPRSELASATLGHDVADGEPTSCAYCSAVVHPLEVFPTAGKTVGSACQSCFIEHVDSKRTDADRFAALMNAFGGGAVRK